VQAKIKALVDDYPSVPQVRRELKNYQKLRELTSRWIALEIELAKLRRRGGSKKS